ncbi:MAG TPA: phage tail protein [Gaiellaceae bacterium]|jgi:phage tail-like protein|nr:phage tail protein [Gaiellaceae bacterium]
MADDDAPTPPDGSSPPPDPGSDPPDDPPPDDDGDDDAPPPPPDASDSAAAPGSRSTANGSTPDPVGELRFQVLLDDLQSIGEFAECSGLSAEYDIFEYQEGGELGYVHKFRGGLKYPNLVLKRGVTHEKAFLTWFFDQTSASAKREHRGNVTLVLLGDDGQPVRSWSFASAFPVKWSGPSFNAKSTNVAMETLEIAHHGLVPTS